MYGQAWWHGRTSKLSHVLSLGELHRSVRTLEVRLLVSQMLRLVEAVACLPCFDGNLLVYMFNHEVHTLISPDGAVTWY